MECKKGHLGRPCIVDGCKNRHVPRTKLRPEELQQRISFHKLPKDENKRKKWIEAIQRHKPNLLVPPSAVICSEHFATSVNRNGYRYSVNNAVPSIFPFPARQPVEQVLAPGDDYEQSVASDGNPCVLPHVSQNGMDFVIHITAESDNVQTAQRKSDHQDWNTHQLIKKRPPESPVASILPGGTPHGAHKKIRLGQHSTSLGISGGLPPRDLPHGPGPPQRSPSDSPPSPVVGSGPPQPRSADLASQSRRDLPHDPGPPQPRSAGTASLSCRELPHDPGPPQPRSAGTASLSCRELPHDPGPPQPRSAGTASLSCRELPHDPGPPQPRSAGTASLSCRELPHDPGPPQPRSAGTASLSRKDLPHDPGPTQRSLGVSFPPPALECGPAHPSLPHNPGPPDLGVASLSRRDLQHDPGPPQRSLGISFPSPAIIRGPVHSSLPHDPGPPDLGVSFLPRRELPQDWGDFPCSPPMQTLGNTSNVISGSIMSKIFSTIQKSPLTPHYTASLYQNELISTPLSLSKFLTFNPSSSQEVSFNIAVKDRLCGGSCSVSNIDLDSGYRSFNSLKFDESSPIFRLLLDKQSVGDSDHNYHARAPAESNLCSSFELVNHNIDSFSITKINNMGQTSNSPSVTNILDPRIFEPKSDDTPGRRTLKNTVKSLREEVRSLEEKNDTCLSIIDELETKLSKTEKEHWRVLTDLKKKIKTLQQNKRRYQNKIRNNEQLLAHLREEQLVSPECVRTLAKGLSPGGTALFERIAKRSLVLGKREEKENAKKGAPQEDATMDDDDTGDGSEQREDDSLPVLDGTREKKGSMYDPEIRTFALTLNYYSPAAYDYVRQTFGGALPHRSTLRGWMSHVNTDPGWTMCALEVVRTKAEEMKKQGKTLKLAISQDDMSLKEHIDYDGTRVTGYVECGDGEVDINAPKANHACTYMVVGLNTHLKVAVGYQLIKSLTGADRAEFCREIINILEEHCNAEVESLTFDGTACNTTMAEHLGASLKIDNLVPSFPNPFDASRRINIILDACHMVKLIRNCWAFERVLLNSRNERIDWKYFDELVKLQTEEGLRAANKASKVHLAYDKIKMNVRVAVQTLSNSVAKAIRFCMDVLKLEQFQGAEATCEFIEYINSIFDILNSSTPVAPDCKAPLRPTNIEKKREVLQNSRNYISALKLSNGKPILKSDRKTGFLGFIVCGISVLEMFDRLIDGENMKFLLTYKLSQDHLEMFFGAIRRRGGWNLNPTCMQFKAAFKQLSVHNEINMSTTGNCVSQGNLSGVLTASSVYNKSHNVTLVDTLPGALSARIAKSQRPLSNEERTQIFRDAAPKKLWEPLTEFGIKIVEYMAGWTVRNITQKEKVKCQICLKALLPSPDENTKYDLIDFKNEGGLVYPASDVVMVCLYIEDRFREVTNVKNLNSALQFDAVPEAVAYAERDDLFSSINEHVKRDPYCFEHKAELVHAIVKVFFECRMHHSARGENSEKIRSAHQRHRLNIEEH